MTPPRNPYQQGGRFNSFYLPEGMDGAEFKDGAGSPAVAGQMSLAEEEEE